MKKTLVLFLLLIGLASIQAATINLLEAGGHNDGVTLNTTAINGTIEQLSAQGGGTLFIPAGTYLTGPITLKSHLTLHLEAGAILRFTDDFDAYLPFVEMRYEGVVMRSFHPLLYAYEAEHITIKGEGTLDGNGKAWWFAAWGFDTGTENKRDLSRYQTLWSQANTDLVIEENSDWKGNLVKKFFRPPFFQAYKSQHIRIEGVTFVNSPFWTINPEFCDNVTVTGVTINNPPSPNTDGINPSSCSNVHISDCHISVGDDCVTIKSGRDAQGRRYATPCQNITITNCTMLSGHGGVVIGSETSGGVKGVVISNCLFDGTDRGIRIKSTRGRGGIVEDIRVSNIVMRNIGKEAITINQFYSKVPEEPVSERTPICRNIHISGLTGVNVQTAGTLLGLPEMPLNGITLRDIDIQAKQGLVVSDAANLALSEVVLTTASGSSITLLRVKEVDLTGLKERLPKPQAPLLKVEACEALYVTSCHPLPGSAAFLELVGDANRGVVLQSNYMGRLKQVVLPVKAWMDDVLKVVE
ncbi:MAG: glycoside hydrolase family 28 protein [Bacteroidales bacterium]|nr:glycoside hydrolase family 28 protein [Bacteroidales bacterium]